MGPNQLLLLHHLGQACPEGVDGQIHPRQTAAKHMFENVAHVRAQPPARVAGVAKGLPPIAWQNDNSKNI